MEMITYEEVTAFNLLEIASGDEMMADLGFINVKLVDILDILQVKYRDELFDSIAIQIFDIKGNEIYYCDCMSEEGDLDSLKFLLVNDIKLYELCDETVKKGYRITLYD